MSKSELSSALALTPSQLAKFLESQIKAKHPILIKGAPGVGKSALVAQACETVGARLLISHPVVSDPTDYKGFPFINKDGEAHFVPFNDLKELIDADSPTVFFLDDIGQSSPAVQNSLMQLLLSRRINSHKVSEHVSFVAATNRKKDKAGVSGMLEPVKSRFTSIVELEPDMEDWVKWALKRDDVPTELISFIRYRPGMLNDFEPTGDMTNSPCPRTIYNAGKLLNSGMPKEIEYAAFAGATGEGFAAEFTGFLRTYRELPNPDTVLMDPANAKVPEDPSALYATCGAISNRATLDNMEAVVTYANRLPADFSVLLIRDATVRDNELCNCRAFIQWASDHSDVIF